MGKELSPDVTLLPISIILSLLHSVPSVSDCVGLCCVGCLSLFVIVVHSFC